MVLQEHLVQKFCGGENTMTLAEIVITVYRDGTKTMTVIGEDHPDGCDANC